MRRIFLRRLIQVLAGSALSSMAIPAIGSAYKEVEWDELMPEGWRKKVILELTRMRRYGSLTDGDPRADEAYARLKKPGMLRRQLKHILVSQSELLVMWFLWMPNECKAVSSCWCPTSAHAFIRPLRLPIKSF